MSTGELPKLTLYKINFPHSNNHRNHNRKYTIFKWKMNLGKTNPAGVVKLEKDVKLFAHLLLSHFSNLSNCSTIIIVNRLPHRRFRCNKYIIAETFYAVLAAIKYINDQCQESMRPLSSILLTSYISFHTALPLS